MGKKTKKQKIIIIASVIAGLLLLAVICFFVFRNMLLQSTITKVANKIETNYNSTLFVQEAKFKGLSGIEIKGISLVPKNADTLFNIAEIKTSVNLGQLLTGDIQLGSLEMKNGYVHFIKDSTGSNFDAFLKNENKNVTTASTTEKPNYAKKAYKIVTRALNLVPTDMVLENLSLKVNHMGKKIRVDLNQLRLVGKQLETVINVQANSTTQKWKVKGFADPRNKLADLKFFNTDTTRIHIPYVDERYGLLTGFDSIRVNVSKIDMNGNELHLEGFASIDNFMVNHEKIAKKDVVINKARFDYRFLFGSNFVALDSTSTVELNKIKFHPFLKYSTEKDTVYQLKATIPNMKAQDFITSLPKALFTNFEGMEAEGNFAYNLDFLYNKNKPNALVFDSNLKKDKFKIVKYGEANLSKLNTGFVYRAVENGRQQRPVLVSPENPNYTPLEMISPYLKKAVLTSEDPSFFSHRGFITEAFKQSIIKNIKTKKFARGGSTISMQLVKNAFLTREKTLSRKLEEILLVYIMENNRIVSKERMLEVYFNIIEWGPNVYGIGEASNYYFQKNPYALTLDECIYLASIIPRPKAFMWRFNNEGNLKEYAERHDSYIKNLMLRRGLITPEDTITSQHKLSITGPARSLLNIKQQTLLEKDSIMFDNLMLNLKNLGF